MKQGWEIKKLGEIATFQRGLTYSKNDEVEFSNNCVLRSNNIELETMSLFLDELKYLREDFVVSEDKKVKKDTILICMSNGSKQHIGKVAFIKKDYDYAFGGFMGLITPKSNIFPKFLFYSCLSSSYKQFLAEVGNGANITNIKFSDLSQFAILIPPLSEQERVVAELDCLSSIIEKKKQQLKEYDALAQSIFYEMFGNPIDNEKGWEVKKLGMVVNSNMIGLTRSGAEQDEKRQYHYFKMNNISNFGGIDLSKLTRVDASDAEVRKYSLHYEDFLFNTRNSFELVGKSCVYNIKSDEIMVFNNNIMRIEFNKNIHTRYIAFLFQDRFIKEQLNSIKKGTTSVWAIYYKDLENTIILVPPISLQLQFAEKVETIEKQKTLLKQSIEEAETLFYSRMEYYFN